MNPYRSLRRTARWVLELLGYRVRDYKSEIHHGEVCMDNVELDGLVRSVRLLARPPECIVEIGSYCGGSTVVIGRAARKRNPAVKVYAIEPFTFHESRYDHDYEALFDNNVREWSLDGTIVKIRRTSHEAVDDCPEPIDFLYIDGDHSYEAVAADIDNYMPKVRTGGIVSFHDFKPVGKEGVRKAIEEKILPKYEQQFLIGSLLCIRKSD